MKQTIALVTGGYSSEAAISYLSVLTVEQHLNKDLFAVYTIDITPSGWFYKKNTGEKISIDKNDFSIPLETGKILFDCVFMCIHGTPGEDGKLQGYFDSIQLPYTTCDAATSALTFNKRFTVAVAAFSGIKVAKSLHLVKNSRITTNEILKELSLPLFIKPNNGGSSIGMSKVFNHEEIEPAIVKAFKEDSQILIEEFIKGREFTIGVYKSGGKIFTLPITEIISSNEFFDFEAKYKGLSKEVTPAEVDDTIKNKVEEAAKKIYSVLNCRGVVRIDFIYDVNNLEPYMLEVNTVPGQSAASLIPQQLSVANISLQEFYTLLIQEAMSNN